MHYLSVFQDQSFQALLDDFHDQVGEVLLTLPTTVTHKNKVRDQKMLTNMLSSIAQQSWVIQQNLTLISVCSESMMRFFTSVIFCSRSLLRSQMGL